MRSSTAENLDDVSFPLRIQYSGQRGPMQRYQSHGFADGVVLVDSFTGEVRWVGLDGATRVLRDASSEPVTMPPAAAVVAEIP